MHWLRKITKTKLNQAGPWQNKNKTLEKLLGNCKWQREGTNGKEKGIKIEKVGSRVRQRLSAN